MICTDPTPMETAPNRMSLFDRLAEEPDHCLLTGWRDHVFPMDGVTYVDTTDELRALVHDLNATVEGQIDPDYIDEQVAHEAAHGSAALAVGFTVVRYGLWVARTSTYNDDGSLTVITKWQVLEVNTAPAGPVTKLEFASVMAAPEWLSAGDLHALQVMGYRDAEDVWSRMRDGRA